MLFFEIVRSLGKDEHIAFIRGASSYLITTFGRVFSNREHGKAGMKWRELRHRLTQTGYHRVNIVYDEGGLHDKYVHRLILETFSPIDEMQSLDCAHKDDDKNNNKISNLMWMTRADNNRWNDKIERGVSKRRIPVYQYDLNGVFIKEYPGVRIAAKEMGVCPKHISECARGIYKQYHGYRWSFEKINI